MDLGLRDRAYVITGGSRGLGYAAAQALVADDHPGAVVHEGLGGGITEAAAAAGYHVGAITQSEIHAIILP